MAAWLREYGPALGPALAFFFGLLTLFLKDTIEERSRRRKSERLIEQFKRFALAYDPPKWIAPTANDDYAKADAGRGNAQALGRYHTHLLAAAAFITANEQTIVDSASLHAIKELYHFKWHFERLLNVAKMRAESGLCDEFVFEELRAYHDTLQDYATDVIE